MPPTYRIRDWSEHFENNRTRDMKRMAWVPIPVKLAGDGYTEMVQGKDGAAIYGAWIACVLAAASCETRGTLLRDNGTAHDATSLSRITRISPSVIAAMLDRAQVVGWIEVAGGCGMPAGIPQEGAAKLPSLESDPRESEGILHTATAAASATGRVSKTEWTGKAFAGFWEAYPRKVAKAAARKAWAALLPNNGNREKARERWTAIMDLLERRLGEWESRPEDKIPHPASWLRSEEFSGEAD